MDHDRPTDTDAPIRPGEIRALLDTLGVAPYKGWGQNFLTDTAVPRRMVEEAGVGPGDHVLEVGPGLGVLTDALLASGARVTAVEIDPRLAAYLTDRFGGHERCHLVVGDILRLDPAALVAGEPYTVVANLPYAITSAVLRYLLERDDRPARLVVMVQEEVARRIVAAPPEMSLLAVSVQLYGVPRLALRVPAGAFTPAPKVDSAVVALTVVPPPLDAAGQARFFRAVAAGFRQRRKTVANALAAGLALERPVVVTALAAAGIDPMLRAERLTVADWLRLDAALATAVPRAG
jgi:16S rRNA (adenine1518-N6/adenine1519-N6)-dimethyltransferase